MQHQPSLTFRRLLTRGLQIYWRLKRGVRFGAEACVLDRHGKVLLIRGSKSNLWHLPIGFARRGEALEATLRRLLRDQADVEVTAKPALWQVFPGVEEGPYDRIGIYIVREWRWASEAPHPQAAFFPIDELPRGAVGSDARGLAQALGASSRA